MFDLIYPDEIAPEIPCMSASTQFFSGHGQESFPVTDEYGFVIGRASRAYCHSGSKVLHPVVHLHIIDRQGCLYLQKRSMKKDIQPGKWDTAVGGHIDYGESVTEALFREAGEELSLFEFNPYYLKSYVFESDMEKEMVNVFAAVGNFSLVPDYEEIDEGRFWPMKEIMDCLGKSLFTPNFEQEFVQIKDSLTALL